MRNGSSPGVCHDQKIPSKAKKTGSPKQSSPGRNVLLTLTLVPLVVGILFIGAWALALSSFVKSVL